MSKIVDSSGFMARCYMFLLTAHERISDVLKDCITDGWTNLRTDKVSFKRCEDASKNLWTALPIVSAHSSGFARFGKPTDRPTD